MLGYSVTREVFIEDVFNPPLVRGGGGKGKKPTTVCLGTVNFEHTKLHSGANIDKNAAAIAIKNKKFISETFYDGRNVGNRL